jgi:hypothetical protein
VELAPRLAHQADDLLKNGVATKIDVSRAQVRLREEQQRLIDAQRDADTGHYPLCAEARPERPRQARRLSSPISRTSSGAVARRLRPAGNGPGAAARIALYGREHQGRSISA